jgi:hypothetical protein
MWEGRDTMTLLLIDLRKRERAPPELFEARGRPERSGLISAFRVAPTHSWTIGCATLQTLRNL